MKTISKSVLFITALMLVYKTSYCWGFFAHQKINYFAVFLLPPEMLVLYKPNIDFLAAHSIDPDKRRYIVKGEAPRHYLDIDHYGIYPWPDLPHNWNEAVEKYSEDTLQAYGIVPWHIISMMKKLTNAFKENNFAYILKYSAEIGHYIADAHTPLHASSNHDGQLTNQKGIHAFFESRIPELLADKKFDFFIGKAAYIKSPSDYIWKKVIESGLLADSVLSIEKELSKQFSADSKYSFEERNGKIIRQYSTAYSVAFNNKLNGMVERRMREAIFCVASFWYTAWVNAGQPNLKLLANKKFSESDLKEFDDLDKGWKSASKIIGREEE